MQSVGLFVGSHVLVISMISVPRSHSSLIDPLKGWKTNVLDHQCLTNWNKEQSLHLLPVHSEGIVGGFGESLKIPPSSI